MSLSSFQLCYVSSALMMVQIGAPRTSGTSSDSSRHPRACTLRVEPNPQKHFTTSSQKGSRSFNSLGVLRLSSLSGVIAFRSLVKGSKRGGP